MDYKAKFTEVKQARHGVKRTLICTVHHWFYFLFGFCFIVLIIGISML